MKIFPLALLGLVAMVQAKDQTIDTYIQLRNTVIANSFVCATWITECNGARTQVSCSADAAGKQPQSCSGKDYVQLKGSSDQIKILNCDVKTVKLDIGGWIVEHPLKSPNCKVNPVKGPSDINIPCDSTTTNVLSACLD